MARPLPYRESAVDGALCQAEVLENVSDIWPEGVNWTDGGLIEIDDFGGEACGLAIVMTQDCDLMQDFTARFPESGNPPTIEELSGHKRALRTILLCEARDVAEIPHMDTGGPERAKKNELERYHCLRPGTRPDGTSLPGLIVDFRRPLAIPARFLYEQLDCSKAPAKRWGVVPEIHSHDLIQRFHSYHSRVATPSEEEEAKQQVLLERGDQETHDALERLGAGSRTSAA